MAYVINVTYRCTSGNTLACRILSQRIIQSCRARFPMINGKGVFFWGFKGYYFLVYISQFNARKTHTFVVVLYYSKACRLLLTFIGEHYGNPHTPNARRQ